MIEDIVGVDRDETQTKLREINVALRELKRQSKSTDQVREVRELYQKQSELQYLPEYLCLVCDNVTQFRKACKGFVVNRMKYHRLVGTTGGVKNSTVVFVSDQTRDGKPLIDELRRRIDNGRDLTKEFVPAKLEAYRALVCSASTPLSTPRGVLVVDDCTIHFKSSYILLKDSETDEPEMTVVEDGDVELIDSDGYGLMSPELARRWGYDLRLDYRPAGICLRNSFCKGMVFAFDFYEFAESVAGSYIVKDIWGEEHDIRNIDLILTASMLKLWDSYHSIDEYLWNCDYNGYCFSATKATPKELDVERRLNYQFIQPYTLTDDQIWELVEPTVTELTDVMGGDYAKALLFLRGTQLDENNAWQTDTPWVAALQTDERMLHDPYVRRQIKNLVKKKITESKFGKLKVHGNFSIISGDPYALCQSIWGQPIKGILKAGEIYNRYWVDEGASELAMYRAPMSSAHNIVKAKVQGGWSASHWYQYMDTITVLNCHDMIRHSLNGADADGDLCFLTDNRVLVNNIRDVLPIQCEQKKATKTVPTEKDFIKANILGFGDDIGTVTNRITAQTELQSLFEPGSPEYEELRYRITAGQHVQQNCIDKTKGIVAKPMAKHWYNEKAAEESGDPIDAKICASKKPYFMIWRYDDVRNQYNAFRNNAERRCRVEFTMELDDLLSLEQPTPEQQNFVNWFHRLIPVQYGRGVMNRICRMCEQYFAQHPEKPDVNQEFDSSILKSGVDYSWYAKERVENLFREYMAALQSIQDCFLADEERNVRKQILQDEYRALAAAACTNEDELCDILVDVCYSRERSKQFAWDMVGDLMLRNLLRSSNGIVKYPKANKRGQIVYCGKRFSLESVCVEVDK